MKKILVFIASVVVVIISASAFVDKRAEVEMNGEAPDLVLASGKDALTLNSLKGKWVILSFWSGYDAVSRMSLNKACRFSRNLDSNISRDIELVAVNFDRSEALMKEISKIDATDNSLQFHVGDSAVEAGIRQAYRMGKGLRTFIINPDGLIVAVDPDEKDFNAIIG